MIPPSYLDELSLLQDRISPFSTEAALNIVENELQLPIDDIFSEITPVPIAAASLGQVFIFAYTSYNFCFAAMFFLVASVCGMLNMLLFSVVNKVYQARLRQNGDLVAVKVQRPGVQAAIALDIFILRLLAGLLKRARKLNTDLQVRILCQNVPKTYIDFTSKT